MTYEFEYFYEPLAETMPIQHLLIQCDVEVLEQDYPANVKSIFGRRQYSVELKSLKVHGIKSGLDLTSNFEFYFAELKKEFEENHKQKVIDRYVYTRE